MLIAGLNPYRLYDDSYQGFLKLVSGQIAAAIANSHAYEEERKRAESLAELDRAKTAFFSNVSHEFRTPLTLMLGPLEEIAKPNNAVYENNRRLVDVAHRNGLRLLEAVNSLLDFSRGRPGTGQLPATLCVTPFLSFHPSSKRRAAVRVHCRCAAGLVTATCGR